MRVFSFFSLKLFSSIFRTGEREVSAILSRIFELYASILDFRSNKFSLYISISGDRSGERQVSAVPSRCPEQYASIFLFRSKNFFLRYSHR